MLANRGSCASVGPQHHKPWHSDDLTRFLSERDIQAWLFVELRNVMSAVRNKYDGKGKTARFGFNGPFDVINVSAHSARAALTRD